MDCSTFAILNATPIVSTFIQTRNGEWWIPESKEWTEGWSECGFTCNTNYHYSWSVCVSDVYTITWLNEDWTLIDTTTVAYGTVPTHADASQDSDDQYDYTFKAWDPTPVAVTWNATYRATYNYNIRNYDISILPNDTNYGTVNSVSVMANYGTLILVNANALTIWEETVTAVPAESGAQYSYGFSGWILNNCETWWVYKVLPNCTITAEFTQTLRQYTVTFVDESGATLKEPTVYDYGTLVENIIKPVDPEKAATAQYTYTFVWWDPTLADVTEDVTYTATYSWTLREYEITWLNEDGSSIDTTMVAYGTVPSHADASQPVDAQYTYEFAWWDPTPVAVTWDATYRATYNYIKNTYTITWLNDDWSLIGTTTLEYWEMPFHVAPLKPADDEFTYYFSWWDPAIVTVVWNAEYKATYTAEKKWQNNWQNNWHNMSGWWRIWNDDSDNQHGSAEEIQDWSEFTGDIESMLDDPNEALSLYEWARENDVTTMDTLEDANPDGLVTRWHLAKMVVNYMVNVLWREMPYDVTYNCVYWGDDESVWESNEIRDYATKACAFWVMGINMENNEFLPNNIVTRAEFWTVMSRVLWWDRYNIIDTDNRSYYEDHLRALKKNGILKQINDPEDRWEIRKWVWLVFRRVKEKKK